MATTATATEPVLHTTTQSAALHTNRSRTRAGGIPPTSARAAEVDEALDTAHDGRKVAPVCVSADEAFRVLGVGRTAGYKSINDGTFPVTIVRIGRIIRVPLIPLRRALGIAVGDATEFDQLP